MKNQTGNKKKDPLDIIADINCLMFGACRVKKPDLTEEDNK